MPAMFLLLLTSSQKAYDSKAFNKAESWSSHERLELHVVVAHELMAQQLHKQK